ncbi:hypothetical protein [Microcoleus sp. D3_18a_C4]
MKTKVIATKQFYSDRSMADNIKQSTSAAIGKISPSSCSTINHS